MKPPQQGSLIKQLCIVFSLAITIAIGAAVIFYTIAFQSLQKEKVYNSENTLENLTQTTEDIASSVVIMAETVSTSSFTHSFLTEKNTAQKIEYQQILNRLVSRLIESSPHINNILLLDNSGIYSMIFFHRIYILRVLPELSICLTKMPLIMHTLKQFIMIYMLPIKRSSAPV